MHTTSTNVLWIRNCCGNCCRRMQWAWV